MLEYEINEITEANLNMEEEAELNNKLCKMKNTQKVLENLNAVTTILDGSDSASVLTMLYNAQHCTNIISNVDDNIEAVNSRINSTRLELEDIKSTCEDIIQTYDFSEEDFNAIDARLDQIKALKRKTLKR